MDNSNTKCDKKGEPEIVYEKDEPQYPVLCSDSYRSNDFVSSRCRIPEFYESFVSGFPIRLFGCRLCGPLASSAMLLRKGFPKTALRQSQEVLTEAVSRLATPDRELGHVPQTQKSHRRGSVAFMGHALSRCFSGHRLALCGQVEYE